MADIFISYARPDRDRIETLATVLEAEGYSVWWDRDIAGGAEFAQVIERELDAAATVIVGWSAHSLGSHWVRDEADYARGKNKLLPVSLDGSPPPLGFRQLHALDFKDWSEDAADPCFRDLMKSLGRGTAPSGGDNRAAPRPAPASAPKRTSGKPGVAVLPLDNMSTDEELAYLADGMSEDVITMLSTSDHIRVAARTSTFAYKGETVDIRKVGAALGARYVVEGSIRKLGPRVRINIQLIDAETGAHCWAKKYDESLENLLASPDEMQEQIVAALFTQLFAAEAARSIKAPPETLGAWEYCMRAAITIGRGAASVKHYDRVRRELKKAIELEPDYALAHALMAWTCNAGIINGLYKDQQEAAQFVNEAKHHFSRARSLAPDDILTQTYLGGAENFAGMQDRAVHRLEGVLARNPANAEAWFILCMAYAYMGRYDDAIDAIDRANRLAPEGGYAALHEFFRGQVYYLRGDYDVARALLERRMREEPGNVYGAAITAICACRAGDEAAARLWLERAREHNDCATPEKIAALMLSQHDKEKAKEDYALFQRLWAAPKDAAAKPAAGKIDIAAPPDTAKPGIAILPFANMSADPEIEFLADGLAEDIITALSMYRCIHVPARASTLPYKDQQTDMRAIGEALGVRYLAQGSVRKLGARARISVQLIEAATGAQLWARKFDEDHGVLLENPDDISEQISGSLFAQLISAEYDRASRLDDAQRGAWEHCVMLGGFLSRGTASPNDLAEAMSRMERAEAMAPDSAIVHGLISWFFNAAIINGVWNEEQLPGYIEKAKKHLRIAKRLADDDPYALVWIGAAENYAGLQDRAVATLEGVLKRNPSSAEAWYCLCQAYCYLGRFDDARQAIERAMALAPEGGLSRHHGWYRGLTEHLAGHYEIALPIIRAHAVEFPEYGYANVVAALEYEILGQHGEALRYIARAKEHNPQLAPEKLAGMIAGQFDHEKGAREFKLLQTLWAEDVA